MLNSLQFSANKSLQKAKQFEKLNRKPLKSFDC